MPWVRIDDHFDEHRKVSPLSDSAFRTFVESLCVSNRNLHDGKFEKAAANKRWPRRAIKELLSRGLWEEEDGSYLVHDYEQYQLTSEQILAERAAARGRMKELRGQRRNGKRSPEQHHEQTDEHNANNTRSSVTPTPTPTPNVLSEHPESGNARAREDRKPDPTDEQRRAVIAAKEQARAEAMRAE